MGAFKKKRSLDKYRVIHDLSWPPGQSINDFISSEKYSVQYVTVEDIVRKIKTTGKGTFMAKLDLADAYRHIRVRPEDWHLLGSMWSTDNGTKQFYVDLTLPFGLRSSAKLFTEFAEALKYIMEDQGAINVYQYLDDFITFAKEKDTCNDNLQTMLQVCSEIGFAVNPNKVSPSTKVIEFLGIVIDTEAMETRISRDRLEEIISELNTFEKKRTCTKRELLSLIGKLSFISRVVKPGRTFTRRMISVAKRIKHLHHHIKLNEGIRSDIQWWRTFLPSWNGISVFADEEWTDSHKLQLYTDASNIAIGCFFQGQWCVLPFKAEYSYLHQTSINFREMLAVIIAITTWKEQLAGKKITMFCDNQAVCHIINSGVSRNKDIMCLSRLLFFICAQYNLECRADHLSTHDNVLADSLSRLDFIRFQQHTVNINTICVEPVLLNWFEF